MNGGIPKYRTGLERFAARRPTLCIARDECTHTKYTRILTYIYRVNSLFFVVFPQHRGLSPPPPLPIRVKRGLSGETVSFSIQPYNARHRIQYMRAFRVYNRRDVEQTFSPLNHPCLEVSTVCQNRRFLT